MGKYAPLNDYLKQQGRQYVRMTFSDIERVVGERLPASKQYPAWWSNNPSNNVMTREWLEAGYETEQVDIVGEKLVFRKVRSTTPASQSAGGEKAPGGYSAGLEEPAQAKLHGAASKPARSIFGCMKGTMTLNPSIDLAAPDAGLASWLTKKFGGK